MNEEILEKIAVAIENNPNRDYLQMAKEIVNDMKPCSSSLCPKTPLIKFFDNVVGITRCDCLGCKVEFIQEDSCIYTKGIHLTLINNPENSTYFKSTNACEYTSKNEDDCYSTDNETDVVVYPVGDCKSCHSDEERMFSDDEE